MKMIKRFTPLIFIILCVGIGKFLPLRFTITDSVEPRLFYIAKDNVFKKGDYILFRRKDDTYSKFSFIKDTIKQISGVAGDKVVNYNNEYFINGKSMGILKSYNSRGQKLLPGPTGLIPEGYVYAQGTGINSFDSRYDEMGWVHESQIIARAIPLW